MGVRKKKKSRKLSSVRFIGHLLWQNEAIKSRSHCREVFQMKAKKWYAVGLGFVLFLCVSAESIVNLIF